MKNYWLLTTDHLEEGLWFRDEEDFKVGMNYVAILVHRSQIVVLAFILMSNHVHFLLKGTKEEVESFINEFKRQYAKYLRHKYGLKEFLRRNSVDIKPIPMNDEAPERAIAYVQMNCVAAGICVHPSQYPWGTGNVFFNPSNPIGRPLGSISKRALIRILHSNIDTLPEDWPVSDAGYVLPQAYVDIDAVESLYRSTHRMNYFLTTSSKAKKRLETAEEHLPAFRDQTILAALPDLCRSLFGKSRYAELSPDDQTELIRQIRYRFSANVNQIARVCGLTYAEAAQKMDSV